MINDKRIVRGAMIRWKSRMVKLKVSVCYAHTGRAEHFVHSDMFPLPQSLAKRAHGIMVDRDANIQRLAFNAWLASHNSKVVVEIREGRHLRSALDVWKGRMDHIVERHRTFFRWSMCIYSVIAEHICDRQGKLSLSMTSIL